MEANEFTATRTALGFSQRGIAQALGTDHATISRWEAGKSRIPAAIELALATLRRTVMATKTSVFRIIQVECPKCDFRMRRELTCTTDEIGAIVAETIETHDLMAHS